MTERKEMKLKQTYILLLIAGSIIVSIHTHIVLRILAYAVPLNTLSIMGFLSEKGNGEILIMLWFAGAILTLLSLLPDMPKTSMLYYACLNFIISGTFLTQAVNK